jgi:hypothetical protein
MFLLTAFHHYYGSVVYHTPWREHVVVGGGLVLLVCGVLFQLYRRSRRKGFLVAYVAVDLLAFGLGIGLFEGLYNHVLKNILFFAGMNGATFRMFFPPPAYEIPGNWIFEISGCLQFFVGWLLIRELWKYVKMMAGG